jgi:hypothetical protein
MNVILLLAEEEHPELENAPGKPKDPATLQDGGQSQPTAAKILRAGSRNRASGRFRSWTRSRRRTDTLARPGAIFSDVCFRVAPEDAGKRLGAELQAQPGSLKVPVQ